MKSNKTYDVVIVGAGAGGGAAAWALTRKGMRVLVLEAGPRFDPSKDYRLESADWEGHPFPEKPSSQGRYSFARLQRLHSKWRDLHSWNHIHGQLSRESRRLPGKYHHVRGVGGSTLHFTGEAHRLHPQAMQMRTRFGKAADWPVRYQELERYYQQAEYLIGVAGANQDRHRPRSKPYPLPPHKMSFASSKVKAACTQVGLNWQENPLAILSRPYDGRRSCNYCGNCARGCPRSDKGSVDITFMRHAMASGYCTLLSECTVTEVIAGDHDRIAGVNYIDSNGDAHQAQGRIYMLACGAIETPRLLLLSTSTHASEGVANETGQVGRHFMETLAWVSHALHDQQLGSHRGVPSDGVCWDFNAPDAIPGVIGGCRFSLGMAESELIGPISYAQRVVAGWGRQHKQQMREQFGRVLSIGAIGECLPNGGSYIDLDSARNDQFGRPIARIHSYLPDEALYRLRFMANKCREILKASGIEKIFEEAGTYDHFSSTHVFGTCRMGLDPKNSVVDADCRSHRWKNLYIVDASVFPSSGGGESPSLTINALALKSAERVRDVLIRRE